MNASIVVSPCTPAHLKEVPLLLKYKEKDKMQKRRDRISVKIIKQNQQKLQHIAAKKTFNIDMG